MLNNESFEKELKTIILNYKKNHLPITLAVADIAHRYNISLAQVYLMIDQLLHEEDDSHMSFKGNKDISPEYVKRRFKNK